MAQTVNVTVNAEDRERLAAVIGDRNRPLKQVQRARIVVLSAERLPVHEIARQTGVSRPSVWRWQPFRRERGRCPSAGAQPQDIVDACCDAWNALPDRIRSIATRQWAGTVNS